MTKLIKFFLRFFKSAPKSMHVTSYDDVSVSAPFITYDDVLKGKE